MFPGAFSYCRACRHFPELARTEPEDWPPAEILKARLLEQFRASEKPLRVDIAQVVEEPLGGLFGEEEAGS